MASFSSPPVALAYFLFAGMGVVALLTVTGVVGEPFVQRRVVPALVLALLALGGWEYRLRQG